MPAASLPKLCNSSNKELVLLGEPDSGDSEKLSRVDQGYLWILQSARPSVLVALLWNKLSARREEGSQDVQCCLY